MIELFANRDPDQMLFYAAFDLDLHCLPITCLGVSRLQWVNHICPKILISTVQPVLSKHQIDNPDVLA